MVTVFTERVCSFAALYRSISRGPISSSFIAPKNGMRCFPSIDLLSSQVLCLLLALTYVVMNSSANSATVGMRLTSLPKEPSARAARTSRSYFSAPRLVWMGDRRRMLRLVPSGFRHSIWTIQVVPVVPLFSFVHFRL